MKKILFALTMLALVLPALPQARADISIDFFYNNLSGGNWIEVGDYGYGWQPDVAVSDPNWRPYADGYWAYTDVGWAWVSYEDFGWATYHYGRWANLADYGWVWFPGSDLEWGPAWVSWRTGGDYVGWAPLPPRGPGITYEGGPIGGRVDIEFDIGPAYYNFIDARFIGEPVLRDRIFPYSQNVTYINNTVNVTNITVQNNVVYNYGPDYNTLSSYSSRPIQRLKIERQPSADLSAAAKTGALTKVQGDKLMVAAPQKINKAAAGAAPPKVKAKVAQPKIEKGWAGVANEAQLKEKIKTENPKNIPPRTGAVAKGRAAGEPSPGATAPVAAGGPVTSPVASATPTERGKRPGRPGAQPGMTGTPSRSPVGGASPGIQGTPPGKEHGRPGLQPGGTIPPGPGEAVPPSERGKAHGRPGLQPGGTIPPGAGEVAPPSERGKAHDRPGVQPGGTMPPGAGEAVPPPERGKPHGRPGVQPGGTIPPQGRGTPAATGAPPKMAIPWDTGDLGPATPPPKAKRTAPTPTPTGAGAYEHRGGPPPGVRQPAGEARGAARERPQGAYNQPSGPPPPRGGEPAAAGPPRGGAPVPGAERSPGQPEHGKKKGEKASPTPEPQ